MAARIQEMNAELYMLLVEAWHKNSIRMADTDRGVETLEYRLFEDGDTQWYQGPGRSWMYISEIDPGGNANFHALNLDGQEAVKVDEVRKILKEMMQDFNLHRLSIILPSPLVKIAHAAQQLGFVHEGRMQEAAVYGGRYVDVEVFGLLRASVDDEINTKRKKRRRRSRRKKKKNAKAQKAKQESRKD